MIKTNEARLDGLFQIMQEELQPMISSNKAANRLFARCKKRAMYVKPELEQIGFESFIKLNDLIPSIPIKLSQYEVNNAKYFITTIFERFNSKLSELNIQETLDEDYLFDQWYFGPGASHGITGTHTVDKIRQPFTCTSDSEHLVLKLRLNNFYFNAFDASNKSKGTVEYKGSKLAAVPKNEDTVRIIAIEPSGNMALQLAAGRYIQAVLKSIGCDISTQQTINKRLAKLGSLNDSLATIDLKSASDMFQPELIRLLFPSKWYDLLMKIRSPSTLIGSTWHDLNMISTMGNGFTFPMMTLCLISLIYAMRCSRNGPNLYIDWTNTAVFGDDIIIPSSEYSDFTNILERAGLIVNYDKSYSSGPFRESCGGDYYLGEDITPFYVRSLTDDHEVFVAINQVLTWGSNHRFLPRTYLYLFDLLRKPFFVPEWSNPDQGILTNQVERRYKFLQVKQEQHRYREDIFAMPLACGGYIESRGSDVYYTPRQYKTRYVVRKGRLPKGFLSGYDPLKRSISQSYSISSFLSCFSPIC